MSIFLASKKYFLQDSCVHWCEVGCWIFKRGKIKIILLNTNHLLITIKIKISGFKHIFLKFLLHALSQKISNCINCFLIPIIWIFWYRKEYLRNLLEIWFLPWFFAFWVRDFKFWLLAYLLISLNFARFQ